MEFNQITRRDFLKLSGLLATRAAIPSFIDKALQDEAPGTYSEENLLALKEIKYKQPLSPFIGITHIAGKYPGIGEEFFDYGLEVASRLGFQTVEVQFSPWSSENDYQVNTRGKTLKAMLEQPAFKKMFKKQRIKNYLITAETGTEGALTLWDLANPDKPFNQETLQSNYTEFYDFCCALHEKNKSSGKKIILNLNNELDWHLFGKVIDDATRASSDVPDFAVENAIALFNTRIRAVQDANQKYQHYKSIKTSVEVNLVIDAMSKNKKRAINSVLPQLKIQPDFIGYSAYDSVWDTGRNPAALADAINFIRGLCPKSRVMISELGLPDNQMVQLNISREARNEILKQYLEVAKKSGVDHYIYWQLLDNEATRLNPNNDECNGYGLIKPDGSLSEDFLRLSEYKMQSKNNSNKLLHVR